MECMYRARQKSSPYNLLLITYQRFNRPLPTHYVGPQQPQVLAAGSLTTLLTCIITAATYANGGQFISLFHKRQAAQGGHVPATLGVGTQF